MTEVSHEKTEHGSSGMSGSANQKDTSDRTADKETPPEDNQNGRRCSVCGEMFSDSETRQSHERSCRRKREESMGLVPRGPTGQDPDEVGDVSRLREELMADIRTMQEEKLRFAREREAFRAEMEREIAHLKEERMRVTEEKQYAFPPQERPELAASAGRENEEGELDVIDEELDRIEPEPADSGDGITNVDLEQLTLELESMESELNTKVDFAALTKMSEDYDNALKHLEEGIDATNRKIDSVVAEIDESGKNYGSYQGMVREMRKLDSRTNEILEEIGFGESLNVGKIPPNILESVYETTIEDVVNEIRKNYGFHDAESIINSTLEDIRTRTSGSELFFFDGRELRTRNLARAIQNKLISAKQVQTTYDELLRKLLEYLPGYKAKNFRAMIKLKSQEFAVDKTTYLLDTFRSFEESINGLRAMLGNVTNRQNSIERSMGTLMASKANMEELEKASALITEIQTRQDELTGMIAEIRERLNGVDATAETGDVEQQTEEHEQPQPKKKQETAEKERKKLGTVVLTDETETEESEGTRGDISEDENRIIGIIPSNGLTEARIIKELCQEISEERIKECITQLIDKGLMSTVKRGRHTVYVKNEETE